MGRHYLATRKPKRIQRIRGKVEAMIERGVPISRLDQKWGGHGVPLDTLLFRIEKLGYTVLCNIENLLEEIDQNYNQAIAEAIAEIAFFAGRNRIAVEDVIGMASEICPPPTDQKYEHRGLNADKAITEHRSSRESPFVFLRHPHRMSGLYYEWRFLHCLSLAQLELLTERLQNRTTIQSSTVLRWTPEPTK